MASDKPQEQRELTLESGDKMPIVGLGTWKAEKGVTAKVVELSLKNGYRLLDCAAVYANEEEVGEGLKASIDKGYVDSRKSVFITSKLWNTFHDPKHVESACRRTLKDLGVEYLDLYLMHFPIALAYISPEDKYPALWGDVAAANGGKVAFEDITLQQTWEAMEKLVGAGLVRNIGISNFSGSVIIDLLRYARIKPAVLQIEIHPYLQQPKLIEWVQQQGIQVTAYSSFGQISYLGLGKAFEWAKSLPNLLTEHKVIKTIAEKHKRSAAQVILRWTVQRKIAVIPKSTKEERIVQNAQLFDFVLDDQDMKSIAAIDGNHRFNDPGRYADHPIFD